MKVTQNSKIRLYLDERQVGKKSETYTRVLLTASRNEVYRPVAISLVLFRTSQAFHQFRLLRAAHRGS